MPKREILVLCEGGSSWPSFLEDYFDETLSRVHPFSDAAAAKNFFDQHKPEIIFSSSPLMSMSLAQAIHARLQTMPQLRIFALEGETPKNAHSLRFDGSFSEGMPMPEFQKLLLKHLPFPEKLRVLIVDDELEIGRMVQDFFERRVDPSFEVRHAENGEKALAEIKAETPDVMILDIKMPIKDGREVYREACLQGLHIPTIVFFDAISGEELAEIRTYGKPAVIEKGAPQSSLPELIELVRKVYFFS